MTNNDSGKKSDAGKTATSGDSSRRFFWTTLPGTLTGVAAVITAVGSLLAVLFSFGMLNHEPKSTPDSPTPSVKLWVVSTMPEDGAVDVDPTLNEIVVTFSQAVRQDRWSFVEVENAEYPEVVGDPFFPKTLTCVLRVQLEAGKTYGIGINSLKHRGFASAVDETVTAKPYVFRFSTRP